MVLSLVSFKRTNTSTKLFDFASPQINLFAETAEESLVSLITSLTILTIESPEFFNLICMPDILESV
ncbi:hypothetical protein WICPIJ_001412 [Wickerhamomyces pijperi]|uniref:Uncharacterized protein n=1 Tax=Wickerhamomyces pijperi TaxID=599730 RepID=A0A9P8QAU1_WICPI|nr:hypothetical protein WICPIJ_001412 [Wickerhamomyces pijperi]